jgi:hypothetical protein
MQVLLLKSIYSSAQSVFEWFGPHDSRSDGLFDFFMKSSRPKTSCETQHTTPLGVRKNSMNP